MESVSYFQKKKKIFHFSRIRREMNFRSWKIFQVQKGEKKKGKWNGESERKEVTPSKIHCSPTSFNLKKKKNRAPRLIET